MFRIQENERGNSYSKPQFYDKIVRHKSTYDGSKMKVWYGDKEFFKGMEILRHDWMVTVKCPWMQLSGSTDYMKVREIPKLVDPGNLQWLFRRCIATSTQN